MIRWFDFFCSLSFFLLTGVLRQEVVHVPSGVLGDCFPDTMDDGLRGRYDEEVIILPNEQEARMLTDPLALEVLFKGRPKSVGLGIPQVHQQAEQLRCLLRLSRVSSVQLLTDQQRGGGKRQEHCEPGCSTCVFCGSGCRGVATYGVGLYCIWKVFV